jgi:hypothetical protein
VVSVVRSTERPGSLFDQPASSLLPNAVRVRTAIRLRALSGVSTRKEQVSRTTRSAGAKRRWTNRSSAVTGGKRPNRSRPSCDKP